jgi:LmbE family N-acetylglucosaminyl deacetylase
MCVLAHPDDETLGTGGILARYAAEGVETYLVTATRGERGWFGNPEENPGLAALGQLREAELRAAATVLGLREVNLFDYIDGDLDQANPAEVIARIVEHVRRVQPDVVVTFDPMGAYGHPDHIAISQWTTGALVCAADASYSSGAPHRVSKFYYVVDRKELIREFEAIAGAIEMTIDGVVRRPAPWEDWAITTNVDVGDYVEQLWQAALCHRTQLPTFEPIGALPAAELKRLWRQQTFYRAFSLVNGGRRLERDLFEGLR